MPTFDCIASEAPTFARQPSQKFPLPTRFYRGLPFSTFAHFRGFFILRVSQHPPHYHLRHGVTPFRQSPFRAARLAALCAACAPFTLLRRQRLAAPLRRRCRGFLNSYRRAAGASFRRRERGGKHRCTIFLSGGGVGAEVACFSPVSFNLSRTVVSAEGHTRTNIST